MTRTKSHRTTRHDRCCVAKFEYLAPRDVQDSGRRVAWYTFTVKSPPIMKRASRVPNEHAQKIETNGSER